jgi:hypothetical protein
MSGEHGMRLDTFLTAIYVHPRLHFGRGMREDRLYVVFLGRDGVRLGWELDPATVREHSWDVLEGVLAGRRRAQVMKHVTRIVGYYSSMNNWNGSKLAERRDRARGNYRVADMPRDHEPHATREARGDRRLPAPSFPTRSPADAVISV